MTLYLLQESKNYRRRKKKNKIRNKNIIRGNKKQAIGLKGSRKI